MSLTPCPSGRRRTNRAEQLSACARRATECREGRLVWNEIGTSGYSNARGRGTRGVGCVMRGGGRGNRGCGNRSSPGRKEDTKDGESNPPDEQDGAYGGNSRQNTQRHTDGMTRRRERDEHDDDLAAIGLVNLERASRPALHGYVGESAHVSRLAPVGTGRGGEGYGRSSTHRPVYRYRNGA